MSKFRKESWDPVLIVSQIVGLQALYYVILGLSFMLLDWLSGHQPSLTQYFSGSDVNLSSLYGATTSFAFVLTSLVL